ncbi:DotI/IcmL/TraM family protein [Acidithiobacillus sp. CV18-2]|nr:DotI/IcmL/TraM family protein [Acidithiobacillus sp. CV18-3]MBU2755905.1 DotI/IcmL/TraM family protein [Acidithiobacillus sp. BN09-2]MBU2776656.1 DotI/IcmL/TraM family protein [Acidithiobacillus sp. CV18-2]MBU2799214.1 DotI/IcmL/TraM family protein [Acidithiobacillus sp. VAN18-4]
MFFSRKKKPTKSMDAPGTAAPGTAAPGTADAPDIPAQPPRFNDLEAEFLGTYHAGKALRMAYQREILIGIFALIFAGLYFLFPRTEVQYKYFATEPNGSVMPLVPFNHPFDSDSTVLSWTEQAVTGIFNFDVLDYRRRLEADRKYFTKAGFAAFIKSFETDGLYKDMVDRKLMVSVVQSGTAVVRLHGKLPNGRYGWEIQIPLHFRLENSNGLSDKRYMANVIVTRVGNWVNADAIAISSISLIEE